MPTPFLSGVIAGGASEGDSDSDGDAGGDSTDDGNKLWMSAKSHGARPCSWLIDTVNVTHTRVDAYIMIVLWWHLQRLL